MDCTNCGASLEACDASIQQTGQGCCSSCIVRDSHGLLGARDDVRFAQLEEQMRKYAEHAAATVIWRKEQARSTMELLRRVESLEASRAQSEALRERLADREQLLREVHAAIESLPERVDVIERCLTEIEARLKLRRRQPPVAGEAMPRRHTRTPSPSAADLAPAAQWAEAGAARGAAQQV